MIKRNTLIFLSISLLSAQGFASEPLPQPISPTPPKEAKSKFERGFRFEGMDVNSTLSNKKGKKDISALLEEILKVEKKQLTAQEDILKILQDQFDPQPKKIVVNGKECIENSSAECFNMPLLHPDAKKVPVLREYVSNPTVENAKKYLQWHAKFLKNAFRGGEAITMAMNKYGAEAFPMNYDKFDYDTPGSYSTVLKKENNKKILNGLNERVEFYFFLGKNADADAYALDNYAKFTKELPDMTYHLVFYTKGAKEVFGALASRLSNIKNFEKRATSSVINKKLFSEHNVYATPMINMKNLKSKKMSPILVGRNSANGIIENAMDVLEFEKVIKSDHSPGYKKWERVGDYSSKYYKDIYGVDLNSSYINDKYKDK